MTAVPMIDVTKEVLERHRTPLEPLRPISAVFDPNNEVIYCGVEACSRVDHSGCST